MVQCWAPDCKHYSNRETCKFFRFPKQEKEISRWVALLQREVQPGPHARVCNCHFLNGAKEQGPILFQRRRICGQSKTKKQKTKAKAALKQQPSGSKQREPTPGDAHDLSHFPEAQIRWWKIKRMQKELEEQQRIFLLEPPSVNVNLLHIKEELIEVEEPELVEIKHEPLDEAEDVPSEDPLTVHIKEESSEGVEPEKRFPFVSLKVKSFTQGPLAGGSKFVPNVPQTIIEDKKIDNKEVDFMFTNFATRFKSLSGRTQLRVKAKISQILAEAEMDELNGQNSRQ